MNFNFEEFEPINIYSGRAVPEMQLNNKYITFTGPLVEQMGSPEYVRLLINPKTNVFAIQKCENAEKYSYRFVTCKGRSLRAKYTSSKILIATIIKAMGDKYETGKYYGWQGDYLPGQKVWVFDINKAYERV